MLGKECLAGGVALVHNTTDLLIDDAVSLLRVVLLVPVLRAVVDCAKSGTQPILSNHT